MTSRLANPSSRALTTPSRLSFLHPATGASLPFSLAARTSAIHSQSSRTSTQTRTMASKPSNCSSFMDAVNHRHSVYALNDKQAIPDSRIEKIVHDIALSVPSSFNTQTTKLVVLLRDQHREFWEIVKAVLRPHAKDEEGAKRTEAKLENFAKAFGTVLFFEDPGPSKAMQAKFPQYADHFPDWSEHTSAMHQFALWTALEAEGFGANLQHYNPIVDIPAKQRFDINLEWRLRAQLVFGGVEGEWPGGKEKNPVSETVKWFGKL